MARITIVESVYFQIPQEQAIGYGGTPVEFETADEEPFKRRYRLDSNPTVLETWLEEPGMIYIVNTSHVGSVLVKELNLVIPPMQSSRFWVQEGLGPLNLIGLDGSTPTASTVVANVTVFPK